jgi:hypothetical protein
MIIPQFYGIVVYEQLDKVCRGEGMERKVWGALGVDLKEGVASF